MKNNHRNPIWCRCLGGAFCLAVVLFVSLWTSAGWAATYYVSAAAGNDSYDGKTRSTAFKTIQKAANIVAAGDTCMVLAGSYNERVSISKSGSQGLPILFQAEGTAVCHGFNVIADYVTVKGFEVTETIPDHWRDGTGIYVEGKYCQILDNYVHDTVHIGIRLLARPTDSLWTSYCSVKGNRIVRAGLSGLEIQGMYNVVESNEISHTIQNGYSDADGVRFMGTGHVFRKNVVRDIYLSDSGNVDPHIDCFQTWGPASNMLFEQNMCDISDDDMQGFMIEESNSPVQGIVIRNNIISAFRIINAWNSENMTIVNNSFKSKLTYTGVSGYGIELHSSPNTTVQNNLFYDVGRHVYPYITVDSGSQTGTQIGYNCVYMSDGKSPAGTAYSNDLWQVNPKLVDVAAWNFQPAEGSPLIDSGKTLTSVTDDFAGTSRPKGSGHDIGAYEFQGAQAAPLSPPAGLNIIFKPE